jgi:uncharacterized protein (DUF1684 family)
MTKVSDRVNRRIFFPLLAVVLTGACSSGPGAPQTATTDVASWRSIRDQVFSEAAECGAPTATEDCSPVPQARRAKLLPLRYYEIDPGYNVPAALRLSEDRPVFEMPTSTGTLRRMERVGVLVFKFNGLAFTVAAFV